MAKPTLVSAGASRLGEEVTAIGRMGELTSLLRIFASALVPVSAFFFSGSRARGPLFVPFALPLLIFSRCIAWRVTAGTSAIFGFASRLRTFVAAFGILGWAARPITPLLPRSFLIHGVDETALVHTGASSVLLPLIAYTFSAHLGGTSGR